MPGVYRNAEILRKIESYGSVKDGRLRISFRDQFDQAIACWNDCRVRVTVEKVYRKRSNPQNSWYWGVIIYEFREGYYEMTGEKITAEQAHEILKLKCNGKDISNKETGEVMTVPGTTAILTTTQFSEYADGCCQFIYEWFGRTVPIPGEQVELEFNTNT